MITQDLENSVVPTLPSSSSMQTGFPKEGLSLNKIYGKLNAGSIDLEGPRVSGLLRNKPLEGIASFLTKSEDRFDILTVMYFLSLFYVLIFFIFRI